MYRYNKITLRTYLFVSAGIIILFALILLYMGRVPWCKCGNVKLWHGVVMSSENSQHISDWYTFSHIIHGLAFYLLLWLIGRRWPIGFRLVLALLLEVGWEIFENSDFIINRYRETTISLDYFGDSVINAVGDVLAMVGGFVMARILPVWVSIVLVLAMELFVGYWIRDNLILNIIMLLYPLEFIKKWQMGG